MSDNLVLEQLRYIRTAVDGIRDELREVKYRVTAVELGLAAVRREVAVLAEADAHVAARMDKFTDRMERIERRLDIVPA